MTQYLIMKKDNEKTLSCEKNDVEDERRQKNKKL